MFQTATLSGSKLSVVVTSSSGSLTLTSTVSGSGSCVVIGMDGNSSMVSGCTQIPFTSNQVVQMMQNSNRYQSDPFYKVFPSLWNQIGNYSAWSWGISRLIDGIIQVKDQLKVDVTKIAVHGCSYAGKMALFGGALDERVAGVHRPHGHLGREDRQHQLRLVHDQHAEAGSVQAPPRPP